LAQRDRANQGVASIEAAGEPEQGGEPETVQPARAKFEFISL
jgi:hypothetical protein